MAWQPRSWAQGGAVHAERFATGEKVDKDWLYTFRDRVKRVEILRELIARASERALGGRRSALGGVGNRGGLPKGIDATMSNLEGLMERYKEELDEVLRQQELVEDWLKDKTPRQRDIVRLRFILGYSIVETAKFLEKSRRYVEDNEKKIFS